MSTTYKDLAGESNQTSWNLNPYLYRDGRYVQRKGIAEVARSLEKISGYLEAVVGRRREAQSETDGTGRSGVSREGTGSP